MIRNVHNNLCEIHKTTQSLNYLYTREKKETEKKEEIMHAGICGENTVDYDRILGHICNLF